MVKLKLFASGVSSVFLQHYQTWICVLQVYKLQLFPSTKKKNYVNFWTRLVPGLCPPIDLRLNGFMGFCTYVIAARQMEPRLVEL